MIEIGPLSRYNRMLLFFKRLKPSSEVLQTIKDLRKAAAFIRDNAWFFEDKNLTKLAKNLETTAFALEVHYMLDERHELLHD